MTRSEAIAAIAKHLEAVDDATLETVAERLTAKPVPTMTVGELLETIVTDSALPRPLSPRELALVEQAKEDFQRGRTFSLEDGEAYLDAELERRRRQRSSR